MRIVHLVLPLLSLLLACGAPQPTVTTIKIAPSNATIPVGATQSFQAQAFDQKGTIMANVTFAWSSSSDIATVSSTGVATGENVGNATVTANANGVVGQASITVTPAPPELTTVAISPSTGVTIKVNQVVTIGAMALDQNGAVIQSPVNFTFTNPTSGVVTPDSIEDNAPSGFSQVQFTGAGANQTTVINVTATFNGKTVGGSSGSISVVF